MVSGKVSVITPFYNAEKYFEEAILSVIAQTYSNWELLLVDDGSRDGSTQIARRFADLHPEKIIYLQHDGHVNKGKSSSRNLGIEKSSGSYISFLDADDVYLSEKLEKQVAILEKEKEAVLVYGPTLYWYSWKGNEQNKKKDFIAKLGVDPDTLVKPPDLLHLYLTKSGVIPCTCGLLARTEIVRKLGGFDESIQHLYEDQVFFVKHCLYGPVYLEGRTWDKYRQHPEMTSNIDSEIHPTGIHESRKIFLLWLENYLADLKVTDPKIRKALNQNLFPYKSPTLYKIKFYFLTFPYSVNKKINRLRKRFLKKIK